jgi:hypothetical protein
MDMGMSAVSEDEQIVVGDMSGMYLSIHPSAVPQLSELVYMTLLHRSE